MRLILPLLIISPGLAVAHPVDLTETSGYGLWAAILAIGAAIVVLIWDWLAGPRPQDTAQDRQAGNPKSTSNEASE